MTREGPTGVGSVPGSPTSISIIHRGRGMTSLDPDIDGGLPWFRGVVPAAGTRPGTRQETTWRQGWFRPCNQPRDHSANAQRCQNTPVTSRKRNPAAFQQCYVGNCLPSAVPRALLRIRFIKNVAPRPRNVSFAPVCVRHMRNLALRGPDRLRGAA